jgi:WD40 repeat protein
MNAIALIAICCITVVISAPNNFDLYYNITFNYDPQMYEYSPDQQFLAITAKNSVLIYDAKSAKLIQAISTNTSGTTTAVSFSRDSGYLAFGNIESIV